MKTCIFKNKVWQSAWVRKIHVKLCPKLNSIEEQKRVKKEEQYWRTVYEMWNTRNSTT